MRYVLLHFQNYFLFSQAEVCIVCSSTLLYHVSFSLSGLDLLQYKDVSFEMLASAFPECLSQYFEYSQRLKIEGKGSF